MSIRLIFPALVLYRKRQHRGGNALFPAVVVLPTHIQWEFEHHRHMMTQQVGNRIRVPVQAQLVHFYLVIFKALRCKILEIEVNN